jgi:sigma-B regulation protein RsbU (phosphoserine phosphatase)
MSTAEQQTAAVATDWQRRLTDIMNMMRETSTHTDPQSMVAAYSRHVARMIPSDGFVALSRRDLAPPKFRITRYRGWKQQVNPWKQKDLLPLLEGGLFGELLYQGEPRIIDDLQLAHDDPAREYLAGQRSLMAIPQIDGGVCNNMIISTRSVPEGFDRERFPEIVWTSMLFGRSTHNLVLAEQVREAYEIVDRELQVVGDIQRALLPAELPEIPTMKLAAHYQTSQRAGGDYYDFFPLPDGRWGILIADVSGHGTPAAVMMAVTHSIAHMYPGTSSAPSDMLNFVGRHLARRYTQNVESFVTAFYAIYDPQTRELSYSSAGHNPPRLKRCGAGTITALDGAADYPLGILADVDYQDETVLLESGDQLVFYTDGIIDSADTTGQLFGLERLDAVVEQCRNEPSEIVESLLTAVDAFTGGEAASDDRTVVAARVL